MYGWGFCRKCCGCAEFFDEFASDLGGYKTTTFSGSPVFSLSGGQLALSGGAGSYHRTAGGKGFHSAVSLLADVHSGGSTTGIFAGRALAYVADWASGQLKWYEVDLTGAATGAATSFSTVSSGDRLTLRITKTATDGVYDLTFQRNGVNVHQETGIALDLDTIETPFNGGMVGDGGQWDNFQVTCGITGCNACDVAPFQWSLDLSAITDQNCSECASIFGGQHTLTHEAFCDWRTPELSVRELCADDPFPAEVERVARLRENCGGLLSAGCWSLWLGVGPGLAGHAIEYRNQNTFDCLGSNVFERIGDNDSCNWPDTLTISPV